MRRFFCILLGLAVAIATPSLAQNTDVWDYVTRPRVETHRFPLTFTTEAEARTYAQLHIPTELRKQFDDYLPIVSVKIALLSHYPSTNAATQALLADAVPTGTSVQNEVRYLAAFKREVEMGIDTIASATIPVVQNQWRNGFRDRFYFADLSSYPIATLMDTSYQRAHQIVLQMSNLEKWQMPALAADVDFVRDSARVKIGEINGFRFSSRQQNLYVKPKATDTAKLYSPLRSTWVREFANVGVGTEGQASFSIVPHGAVECQIGTASSFNVLDGVVRLFSTAEVAKGVRITPIDAPTVATHIANQTVEATTEQTLDYSDTFAGTGLTYAITSSQESVLRVRLGETGIAVLEGVSAGNSTVRLTATNPAGSAISEFIVTVTARSE